MNILVKRAMADDKTEPVTRKFKKVDPFTRRLLEKMKCFEKYLNPIDNKTYKFNRLKPKPKKYQK